MKKYVVSTVAALVIAGGAQAQGFENGGVTLSYEGVKWSGGSSIASDIGVSAFGIFSLGSSFDVQVGAGYMNVDYGGGYSYADYNYNIHGIYNISPDLRAGVFYSSSTQWEDYYDIATYGVEIQYDLGAYMIEAQAGSTVHFGADATFAVLRANYDFGAFDVDGIYAWFADDFDSTSMIAARASYGIPSFYNTEIYGQVSYHFSPDYPSDEAFFEVGLTIPFGNGGKEPFYDPNEFMRAVYIFTD